MKTFFLSLFTVSCFLPFFLSAQSLDWKTRIYSPALTVGPSAEFKTTAVGPDGRIYSTGYFIGYRAQIGNTVLKADSAGFKSYFSDSTIFSTPNTAVHFPLSIMVTCHETNGALAWAKTITSVTASDFGAELLDFRYLSGNKIAFDAQGNLILTGTYVGDTLKYDGVPFENNIRNYENSSLYRILVLKISSTGSLLWGHSEMNQSIQASTTVKSLRHKNGIVEALVFQPSDSSTTNKYSLFRYSDSGIRLPSVTYHPQGGANSW
ncbi:MAG TPA: hypothetical protein PK509_17615, partial [Catalimonadaceae bacterium]|nr:hypothetical protein [Catalimonadaceae bacterium]